MSLILRGGIWHYSFTVRGYRYRGTTHCRRKSDARIVEDRERRAAELGEAPGPKADWSLATVSDAFFRARGSDKKSVDDIAARLATMVRLIGRDTPVNEIGPKVIEAAIQARRMEKTRNGRPPTNATVNRDLIDTTLRPMLRYAAHNLEIPVRPILWRELRLPEPKGRTRTFTNDELAAWRSALPPWHQPIFDFFVRYGVRLGEVFFPNDAVNLEEGTVTLRARKAGDDHVLPLLPDDVKDLAARIGRARAAGIGTPWLRQMKNGTLKPVVYRGFEHASRTALDAVGIKNAKPAHDLRHHAATQITRRGGLKAAQIVLGHASIISTQRYAHPNRADTLAALGHKPDHTVEEISKNRKENNN
jgi:integrase